jgi:hypothetical protein
VAGWLDAAGRPAFVYLEITGYYLTAMAWLAEGGGSGTRADEAVARGREALGWIRAATANGALPPTRVHLTGTDDWRNAADFTFDLAMALRGVVALGAHVPSDEAAAPARALADRLRDTAGPGPRLGSHTLRAGAAPPPERWSTRPGPHHLKAAAALLTLPDGLLDPALAAAARASAEHWRDALRAGWPGPELHPLFYGLEGLIMMNPAPSPKVLDLVGSLYDRLLALQARDATLPAELDAASGLVRSDVLAQALRVGAWLVAWGRRGSEGRLDALAAALGRYVRDDGGVAFAAGQDRANAWCAMFALQALAGYAGTDDPEAARTGARLLV